MQMVSWYTHLSKSHKLAAVELLCKPELGATGTTTGTSSKRQDKNDHVRPD
jgi:hypothetical protein